MKIQILSLFLAISMVAFGQEEEEEQQERIDEKIDQVTYDWDREADQLSSYTGLRSICLDEEYRNSILDLLQDIHHYDTILYRVLVKLSKESRDREIDRTLSDIKKFETEYDTKSFINFMSKECKAMKNIEKHANRTKNEVGSSSYSGQTYLLETELFKYVKHVTERVDKIRKHVHHLSSNF